MYISDTGSGPAEILRIGEQAIAVRRRGQAGRPVVLVHGNSCSSRCFERQLVSPLAARFRVVAIEMPGHGDSSRAAAPDETYTLPGYSSALVAVAVELGLSDAVFVGWSLGGHVVVEASDRLPGAAGFFIVGTSPMASNADVPRALSSDPALLAGFREESTDEEVLALLTLFFRPGFGVPPSFVEDFRRTDKRARSSLAASIARNEIRDEAHIVAQMNRPLAVVFGAHDAIALRGHVDSLSMPTLWRSSVQTVPEAGHAPHWENPEKFNRLLEDFVVDCSKSQ
jgi:pimeloyl-ACP methyl ester carboxylesterase